MKLYELKLKKDKLHNSWVNKHFGICWCYCGVRRTFNAFDIPEDINYLWVSIHDSCSPNRQKMYLLKDGAWEYADYNEVGEGYKRCPSLSKTPNIVPGGKFYDERDVWSDDTIDEILLKLLDGKDKKIVYIEVCYE